MARSRLFSSREVVSRIFEMLHGGEDGVRVGERNNGFSDLEDNEGGDMEVEASLSLQGKCRRK